MDTRPCSDQCSILLLLDINTAPLKGLKGIFQRNGGADALTTPTSVPRAPPHQSFSFNSRRVRLNFHTTNIPHRRPPATPRCRGNRAYPDILTRSYELSNWPEDSS